MLSYRIKQARHRAELNQGQLAELLNISRTAVVNWETGYSKPKEETVGIIADILKVEKEWLLDTSNDEFETMETSIVQNDEREMTFNNIVGARLRYCRKRLGLTLEGVAEIISSSRSTVGGYETNGREPNFETLNKLADLYNISVDHLLGRTKHLDNPFNIEDDSWIFDIISANAKKKETIKQMWNLIKEL